MGVYGKGAKPTIYPSLAKEVYDVCGAGDTAISLLSLTLSNKVPIDEAVYISNVACGIVVGKHGTATTNQQEILSWVAKSN
jgi:D-beta-D-heptose 7-phosphate kinase/D-beta-D-heptose 1-phosphate adenosyltransferase